MIVGAVQKAFSECSLTVQRTAGERLVNIR